jgi:hypothetical protein
MAHTADSGNLAPLGVFPLALRPDTKQKSAVGIWITLCNACSLGGLMPNNRARTVHQNVLLPCGKGIASIAEWQPR